MVPAVEPVVADSSLMMKLVAFPVICFYLFSEENEEEYILSTWEHEREWNSHAEEVEFQEALAAPEVLVVPEFQPAAVHHHPCLGEYLMLPDQLSEHYLLG